MTNKVKLIYIDCQSWKNGLYLFNLNNQDEHETHEFLMKKNIVNLYTENENTTITTKENLKSEIINKISNSELDNITITDYELSLEEIFNDIIDLAKEYKININIIEKSKYPIRNNVTMTIDLKEYDNETKYEEIKDMLEKQLENSLNNSRKSKSPKNTLDLGVNIENENNFLSNILMKINEYDLLDYSDDDIITMFDPMSLDVLEEEPSEMFTLIGERTEMTIIGYKDKIDISKDNSSILINKKEAKRLIKILEVLANE